MGSDGRDLAARELKKPKKPKKNEGASASASGGKCYHHETIKQSSLSFAHFVSIFTPHNTVELDPDPAYSAVAPVEADCRTRACGRGKKCLVNNRGEHKCMKAPKKGKLPSELELIADDEIVSSLLIF